jgi:hypothetical protein
VPATLQAPRRRIAVADDNSEYLMQRSQLVGMAGFEPVPLKGHYRTVGDLIDAMRRENATGLICDHKLTEGDYAGFEGVEAVAALYGSQTPAILVTDYVDSDLRQSIRKFRKHVPVLIKGSDLRPKVITAGLEAWEREVIHKNVPVQRRALRALVEVDDIAEGPKCRMLTVFVPRWREHEAVQLSEDMIPPTIRPHLKKGVILTASVNVDAERIEDLFFDDFELTPEEDLEHEPA